ncbi:zinc ribbon-containing protein [Clostridium sp. C8-1-8]|nr:zinc ribbon-containing protein [Clostridium sp. C8-1-8]
MPRSGQKVEQSGIYKCTSCGNEVTCVKGEPFPPCAKCNNSEFRLVRATK